MKIRFLREQRKWSQRMLADHAGIEQAHLARIENGQVEPGVILLEKVAIALEVEIAELFRDTTLGVKTADLLRGCD